MNSAKHAVILGVSSIALFSGLLATTVVTNNSSITEVHAAQTLRPGYLTARINGNTVSGVINKGANVYIRQNGRLIKTIATGSQSSFSYTLPAVNGNATITISTWKPGYTRKAINLIQSAPAAYLNAWLTGNTLHAITNAGATVYIHQDGKSVGTIHEAAWQSSFTFNLPTSGSGSRIDVITTKAGRGTTVRSLNQPGSMVSLLNQDAAKFKSVMQTLPNDLYGSMDNPTRTYNTDSVSDFIYDVKDSLGDLDSWDVSNDQAARQMPAVKQLLAYYQNRLSASDFIQMQKLVNAFDGHYDSAQTFWNQFTQLMSYANYGSNQPSVSSFTQQINNDGAAVRSAFLTLPTDLYSKLDNPTRMYRNDTIDNFIYDVKDSIGDNDAWDVSNDSILRQMPAIQQLTNYYKTRLNSFDFQQMQKIVSGYSALTLSADRFWPQFTNIMSRATYTGVGTPTYSQYSQQIINDTHAFKAAMLLLPDDLYSKMDNPTRTYSSDSVDNFIYDVKYSIGDNDAWDVSDKDASRQLPAVQSLLNYYHNRLNSTDYSQMAKLVSSFSDHDINANDFWPQFTTLMGKASFPLN